jgi:hypothetical protein
MGQRRDRASRLINRRLATRLASIVLIAFLAVAASAKDESCTHVVALARMARAASLRNLRDARSSAGDGYRADLVSAWRAFRLQPSSRAAAAKLLALIPQSEDQQTALMTLGDSLCDAESLGDISVLAGVQEGMPKALARAVLLVPELMPGYARYSLESVQDPHSDFAVRMRSVCLQAHRDFLRSVESLDQGDREWFRLHVMVPETCRVLAMPEAD